MTTPPQQGQTALHVASKHGFADVCDALFERFIEAEHPEPDWFTADNVCTRVNVCVRV